MGRRGKKNWKKKERKERRKEKVFSEKNPPPSSKKTSNIVQFILLPVNFLQEDLIDRVISLSSVSGRLCTSPILGGGAIFLVQRRSSIKQSWSRQKWPFFPVSVSWSGPISQDLLQSCDPQSAFPKTPISVHHSSSCAPMEHRRQIHLTLDFCSSHALADYNLIEELELISLTPSQSLAQSRQMLFRIKECGSRGKGAFAGCCGDWDWSRVKKPEPPSSSDKRLLKVSSKEDISW